MWMLIGLILLIYWVVEKWGADAGGWVVLVVLLLGILIGIRLIGNQNRAYSNWVRKWKDGDRK